MTFIDEARLDVVAGDGGNGCIAFRREKFVPKGGPSGGDGGDGGSVILIGDAGLNTLFHLRHARRQAAERGRHGEGSERTGRRGADREVRVPLGTLIYDAGTDELVGEVLEDDERFVVAAGGRGGRGNARFATSRQRAPRKAEDGREGEQRELRLELKLLADVGLVGLPNAGKSTLIGAVSAARPRIADYPFTTLVPQLGVVADGPLSDPFVLADLPGLIQGAAEGAGLGYQFLRHVERCRVLVHLVDLSGGTAAYDPDGADLESLADAGAELAALEGELGAFDPELLERRRLVVGSKLDAALPARRESLRAAARARDLPYLEISSVTRDGLEALRHALRSELAAARADSARADAEAADARSAAWPTPPHLQQSAAEARGEGEGE